MCLSTFTYIRATFYDFKKMVKFSQADKMCIEEAQQREE